MGRNSLDEVKLGPPSAKPCDICGQYKENQIEPRFAYTVCKTHRWTPPVMIHKERLKCLRN